MFHLKNNSDPEDRSEFLTQRGTTSGRKNGLSVLVDTESYNHGFSGAPGSLVLADSGKMKVPPARDRSLGDPAPPWGPGVIMPWPSPNISSGTDGLRINGNGAWY